ncbi:MAG: fibronectin type III domain-containing protein [Bacilli bacterium]|nr:fibronectin type III domain-containing protein [Bacilli bacterium]
MKKILVVILCLFLVACSPNSRVLSYPQDIAIVEEMIHWSEVNHANQYIISLNGDLATLDVPQFSIADLEEGVYHFKVKAIGEGYEDSLYSTLFTFTIDHSLPAPTSLVIEETTLSWTHDQELISYDVHINQEIFNTLEKSYDLSGLAPNTAYEIYIIAKNTQHDSLPSEVIDYYTYENLFRQMKAAYDKASEESLTIDLDAEVTFVAMEGNDLSPDLIEITENTAAIDEEYFKDKSYGSHIVLIPTSRGMIVVKVKVIDSRPPEVENGPQIKYKIGEYVRISFVNYDKELVEITGNGITLDDYEIKNQKITIDYRFIENIFNEDDSRQTIILAAHFLQEGKASIVYFYINRR